MAKGNYRTVLVESLTLFKYYLVQYQATVKFIA